MTERKKDLLALSALLALLILFFSRILFTDMIIRAPDIINEFYWGVVEAHKGTLSQIFDFSQIKAAWNIEINSGFTTLGGNSSFHFVFWNKLLFYLLPAPASVAWCIVLHFFAGAAGLFCYCRMIGMSRMAAFLAGAVFALAPETASLINAGHVMKIATIAYAPWAFYCLERGYRSRRSFWFLATAFVLAFQFFNSHWQISYYTCLAIGIYGVFRSVGILRGGDDGAPFPARRLLSANLMVLFFFLTTVSMSLAPLASWSQDTNRGVESGANQGKGGLDRDEAMSWSLPPEELGAFVIPGFFGFSRQEAGENPPNIDTYYWGRMNFTQTVSYMGLLPWLLVPLPLIFRRNRYTLLALGAVVGGVLFSMGKYTPFYNLLFDYFPGINRFRVPKMMMFIPVMGLGVLAGLGLDILLDPVQRATKSFKRYALGVALVPVALLALLGVEWAGKDYWMGLFSAMLNQPTRYQAGAQLALQRWNHLMLETCIAAGFAICCAAVLVASSRRWFKAVPFLLLALYLADVWRVDDKFMFLVEAPHVSRDDKTPVTRFLNSDSNQYRVLPMDGSDPMQYVSNKIPVMFTSNAVQQRRWQEFLDGFNLSSSMPDILNVKYLVYGRQQYEQEKAQLSQKFPAVFMSPDGRTAVLENRTVLPKAWLVPSAAMATPAQTLGALQNPSFNPRFLALVESPPPIALANPGTAVSEAPGAVRVTRYQGEQIELEAAVAANSLLVLGEKYYKGWYATVDGAPVQIYPVDHVLRGVYLTPGRHKVEFVFDPVPFKVGKYLTFASFLLFGVMLARELRLKRPSERTAAVCQGA